jgi:hypothetical protein
MQQIKQKTFTGCNLTTTQLNTQHTQARFPYRPSSSASSQGAMIFHLNVTEWPRELFRNLDSGIWTKVCVPNRGKDGTFDSKRPKPVERPVSDPLHQSTRRPQSICVCVCLWVGGCACMHACVLVRRSFLRWRLQACKHVMCIHVHLSIHVLHACKPHAQNKGGMQDHEPDSQKATPLFDRVGLPMGVPRVPALSLGILHTLVEGWRLIGLCIHLSRSCSQGRHVLV